jgi:glycosyltransferase involved in cell wall biosynthesis
MADGVWRGDCGTSGTNSPLVRGSDATPRTPPREAPVAQDRRSHAYEETGVLPTGELSKSNGGGTLRAMKQARTMRRILAPAPERPIAAVAPPSFSIIIPAYQAAAFIADAVESALTQAVAPAEVIVCDDGSTDELAKALRPFSGRITVLRKEHGGAASARNLATRSASSEFVAFLDADNIFLPGHLEAVGDLAAMRPDLDILTTDAFLELDGHIYGRYYRGKARFIVEDQRRGIIHQHFIFGNAAFRREALLAVGGYDETVLAEDTDLFLRMILGGSRVGLVDEPLCVYRIRSGTLSSNLPRSLRSGVVVLERARNHPSLTSAERRYLHRELADKRREAELAEAEEALRGFAPHPRRRALKIVFGPPGYGFVPRMKALAAALAPRIARRYLERLEERTGRSRLALQTRGR